MILDTLGTERGAFRMYEATKTNRLRSGAFKRRYFSGKVIDIGCGPDPVTPEAIPFDQQHGDAQYINDYFSAETFDCVHSSHCLEHMRDVPLALSNWWQLVKPGGYLIVVVPDEDLYEQGLWPSIFNSDHKATFRLDKLQTWSPVSYEIRSLIGSLKNADIIEATRQDAGYDYRLMTLKRPRWRRFLWELHTERHILLHDLMRRGLPLYRLNLMFDVMERALGRPIDQLFGDAVAQIQIVAKKKRVVPEREDQITQQAFDDDGQGHPYR
jgi:SAM-dependent methyltransferase